LEEEKDLQVERRGGGRLFHARGPATANYVAVYDNVQTLL